MGGLISGEPIQQPVSIRAIDQFTRARQAVPEEKLEDLQRQVRWITELLG